MPRKIVPAYEVFQGRAKNAKAAGYKYYNTNKPCKRGHYGYRRVNDMQCITCQQLISAPTAKAYQKKHPLRRRVAKTKARCKANDVPFDEAAYRAVYRERGSHCPVFSTEFVNGTENKFHPDTPEMDRIIPELGYVRGNMWVISRKANRIKTDAVWRDILRVAMAVREKLDDQVQEFHKDRD